MKHRNIGLLVGSMSSNYHEGIVRGAYAACESLGCRMTIYAGGPIHSDNPLVQSRDSLFNLVDADALDALIIPVSSLTRYMTSTEIELFFAKYSHIPIINIGTYRQDLINIIPDYESGLKSLIQHFINDHGYKRIVLLRGPMNHDSSNIRTDIYRKQLIEHGLEVDEDLIIYGDLERNSAQNFTEALISKGIEYDAIIAINSNATISMIGMLQKKGIQVPEDTAFAGTSNLSNDVYSVPSLTMMNEDFDALGRTAMEVAVQAITDLDVKKLHLIEVPLVMGESCGCHMEQRLPDKPDFSPEFKRDLKEQMVSLHENLNNAITSQAITKELENAFGLYQLLQDESPKLLQGSQKEEMLKQIFHETILSSQSAIRYRRHETMFYLNFLRDIGNIMNTSFDLSFVENYVMAIDGIRDCYINIFDRSSEDTTMRNIVAIKNHELVAKDMNTGSFDARYLIPPSYSTSDDSSATIALPLIFRSEHYGNLVMNYNNEVRGSVYEALETLISTTVKNEMQIQDLIEVRSRFDDMLFGSEDWLIETNEDHEIVYCSSTVTSVLGYKNYELIGRSIEDMLLIGTREALDYMNREYPFKNIDCCMYHKDLSLVYLSFTAKPIFKSNVFCGFRGVLKNITKSKIQEETIRSLASYDILTGLPNRSMMKEQLADYLAKEAGPDDKGALLLLNIDRFKHINDTLGHSAGDKLLQMCSESLKDTVIGENKLARIAGDEFAVIMKGIQDDHEVLNQIKRITMRLDQPYHISGQKLYITLSMGIAMSPNDGCSSDQLLKNADSALHRAKSYGRNQYVFFDPAFEEKNHERMKMESLLRDAIDNGRLIVHYQPQVHVMSGKLIGLEALVRIQQEDGSLIYPGAFISIAEEVGLIGNVDKAVLAQACQDLQRYRHQLPGSIKISVNLSPSDLKAVDLVTDYKQLVSDNNIMPSQLQFELTENALVQNEADAKRIMTELNDSGFRVALDDFGTGYSSLAYIASFPFDTIKIDRSFIANLNSAPKNSAIIGAMQHMTSQLGMDLIIEGAETEDQIESIKALNCQVVQGYYYSKPVDMAVILDKYC